MDHAWKSGAIGTPPATPSAFSIGYPTAGDPSTSTPATKQDVWWYHMITEELRNLVTSAGIVPAAGTLTQVKQALDVMYGAGRLIGLRVFTTANSGQVFVPTVGAARTIVQVQAPGGGSGGAPSTSGGSYAGSTGASSGSYAECSFMAAQIAAAGAITMIIPGGGVAGGAGSTSGGNGSTASFGSLVSCPGGLGSSSWGATVSTVTFVEAPGFASAPSVSGTPMVVSSGGRGGMGVGSASGGLASPSGGASVLSGQSGYGCGAPGIVRGGGTTAAAAGNVGGDAVIIVMEFA